MNTIKEKILNNLTLSDSLPQEVVDIADKKRSNLFTWRGQFSPQLVDALIKNYSKKGDILFDPFLGSGTLLLESAFLGFEAYGVELNPAAYGLATIYELTQYDLSEREKSIEIIEDLINDYLPLEHLFSQLQFKSLTDLKDELVDALNKHKGTNTGIIINALIIGLDFEQKKLDLKKLQNAWYSLKDKIRTLPFTKQPIKAILGDARETPLNDSCIDLVVTSPPYINVFNYHQNYRKSVEATGFDILKVAKSEIGSNRKFRSNRYLTVIQYSLDIYQVFQELKRVCKNNAKIIFIVGRESSVRKTPFPNAKILTEVAKSLGFILEGEQPRMFRNKFGQNIYEEILRFSINKNVVTSTIESAREIAIKYLNQAVINAPSESLSDLKDAINKALNVQPSIIYKKEL